MVSYKEQYLELKKHFEKLEDWCIDLRPNTIKYRKERKIPIILSKRSHEVIEKEEHYLLYDV